MSNKNRYYDPNKAHHTPNGFCNIEPFNISSKDILKWKKQRHVLPPQAGYQNFTDTWCQVADFSAVGDSIWWLGHATTLIKIDDKVILTDPIFSDRASPLSFVGPQRKTASSTEIEDLPRIDIIVISHNHYDHLDYMTIRQLIKLNPLVTIVVPLGLKPLLLSWGGRQVIELDWWDSIRVDGTVLTAIPTRHWSKRTLFDTNQSLWCGWMIQYKKRSVCFMGDTGYMPQFVKIAQRFPVIDIALIPIGSYAPRWFMQDQHIDPQQAVQLFKDIGCIKALAIHWGAFELADEALDEPPSQLWAEMDKGDITKEQFLVIKMGEHISI